jgi:zinc/manganese transport system substrate-binding protein/manganese/iron transport system substrate-binding protein
MRTLLTGPTNENEFQYAVAAVARRLLIPLLAAALAAGLAACGEEDGGTDPGRVKVVATTTQAADLARNVGGDRVDVEGLLAPNADPHEYEVRPDDVKALADADVVVRSGGDLDAWLDEAIENAGGDPEVVTLLDAVKPLAGGHDHEHAGSEEEEHAGDEVDPHWWQDPRNAELAVAAIERALSRADPEGASGYRSRADAYTGELRRLDRAVARCWDEVPASQRKLVTTHDALGYYARRYHLEVVGAVIPSLSTRAQPSAGDTAELIDLIRRERVRAIFAESSVNPKVEQAIARETGARVGRALWADSLGPAGSDGATYLRSMASNTRSLVGGVTGGTVSCSVPAR